MLSFRNSIRSPEFKTDAVVRRSAQLADRVAEIYQNNLKLAITRQRAIASGKTLQSVKAEFIMDSPMRGQFRRAVTAKSSWWFIQVGRKKGAKMPIRQAGTNSKGKPIFEPLPELVAWFRTLGIPRQAWFPILFAIKRRGIRPRRIRDIAMRQAQPTVLTTVARFAEELSREMFVQQGANVQVNKYATRVTPKYPTP